MNARDKFNEIKKFLLLYSSIFVLYIVLLPKTGFGGDFYCWKTWCIYIFNEGLSDVYSSTTDYPPAYHYILMIFGCIQGSIESIQNNIYYLKVITLIFDFIAGYFLIKLLREKFNNRYQVFAMSLFYFLNICVFYNTIIWGQIDGILACFIFLSFYYAYKNKLLLSLIFYVVALNFKLQAIIFFPFIGLIILPSVVHNFNFRKLALLIIVPIIVEILILLPFIINDSVDKIWTVTLDSFGKYPYITMNAYNMWNYFIDGDPMDVSDGKLISGIACNKIGLILFCIASVIALIPLLKLTFNSIKTKSLLQAPIEKLLIIGSLVPLLFFLFKYSDA